MGSPVSIKLKGMTPSCLNLLVANTSAIGVGLLRVSLYPLLCWPSANIHHSHFYGVHPSSRDSQASKTVFILFLTGMVNFLPVYDGIDVISLEKLEGITTPIHDVK